MDGEINNHTDLFEYYDRVLKADMSNYDIKFVDFYRFGKIIINNKEHILDDLYIEIGMVNNIEKNYLIDYHEPNTDLITNEIKNNYKRKKISILKDTMCLYQIYQLFKEKLNGNLMTISDEDKEKIKNIIYSYNGQMHDKTPETYNRKK